MRSTSLVSLGPIGPHAALVLLTEWFNGRLTLTHEDYDVLFDSITGFLERINDQKFTLQGDAEKED